VIPEEDEERREAVRDVLDARGDEYQHKVDEYNAIMHIAPDLPDSAGHFQILSKLDSLKRTLEYAFFPDGCLIDSNGIRRPGELVTMNVNLKRIADALEAVLEQLKATK
jgi:hypothetical protein